MINVCLLHVFLLYFILYEIHEFKLRNFPLPIASMVLLYMVLHGSHQYTPVMDPHIYIYIPYMDPMDNELLTTINHIPAPWIRHDFPASTNAIFFYPAR